MSKRLAEAARLADAQPIKTEITLTPHGYRIDMPPLQKVISYDDVRASAECPLQAKINEFAALHARTPK